MNTATALIRITAAASAVALGVALAGCQGTRSDKTSESAKTSVSSAVRDDLSPMQARQMEELFRLPVSTVDDDLSPNGSNSTTAPSTSPADEGVATVDGVDDDLSPLGGP
ncbi:hypothetical protein [Agromyces sp. SYSU T00266]|uniref:hypothetical protein n=1 Tax=Agromyces zhanjiangensis TaxID=3158562 RepID=UPI0033929DC2